MTWLYQLFLHIVLGPLVLLYFVFDGSSKHIFYQALLVIMSIILLPFWIIISVPIFIYVAISSYLSYQKEQKSIARGKQYLKEENIHLLRNENK